MIETSSVKAGRIRWTSSERMAWLDLFRTSEQSAAEFCRNNDLSYATFSLWLRQSESAQDSGEGEIIEVPVAELLSEPVPTTTVNVHLPNGARLEIVSGTDPAWLAHLVRALAPVGE
jgi:hypothetical protein